MLSLGGNVEFWGFHKIFGNHLSAKFGRDLADLSRSYEVPSISPRRIDLAAADLTPVPRYRSWKLIRTEEAENARQVPEESFFPAADLSLALAVPPGAFVADSCGDAVSGGGRLTGGCRLPVAELAVAGGPQRPLPRQDGGATVAVLPFHRAQGDLHLGFIARGERRLDEAWPGIGDLRRTVVLESPPVEAFALDSSGYIFNRRFNDRWSDVGRVPVRVQGELVRLNELDLAELKPIEPNALLAEVVAARLSRRRAVAAEDGLLFRRLLRELVMSRLGLRQEAGAVVSGVRKGMEELVRIPPPAEYYSTSYWNLRFPALVAALRYRMGRAP